MKKRIKIKLSLNSQTIRRLPMPGLKEVQGGLAVQRSPDDSVFVCYTDNCRGCG